MTSNSPALTLYELAAADPDVRFSPHCWKTRMALAHKGLEAAGIPWRFTDKDAIAFANSATVPVLVDRANSIADSWRIALYLEQQYPDRPSLFRHSATVSLSKFVNDWADTTLLPAIARIVLLDIYACIDERDRAYFRSSREKRFGMVLEQVVEDRRANAQSLALALSPLRSMLRSHPFIAGASPAYADYCVFGMFMWAHCVSAIQLLEPTDPIFAWRQSLFHEFDALALTAKVALR